MDANALLIKLLEILSKIAEQLSAIVNSIGSAADALSKAEKVDSELIRNGTEFKYEFENILERQETLVKSLDEVKGTQNTIKECTSKVLSIIEANKEASKDCAVCKEKDKWIKRLVWISLFLFLAVVSLLGLNAAGILKLHPGNALSAPLIAIQ